MVVYSGETTDRPSTYDALWKFLDRSANDESEWLDGKAAYIRENMVGINDLGSRIGMGVQYVVYELPGDRVFKVAHNPTSSKNELARQGGVVDNSFVEEVLRARDLGAKHVEALCSWSSEACMLFGNPIFNGELGEAGAFEQDRVVVPSSAFVEMPRDKQIAYVKMYIRSLKKMWRLGCSDKVFNFEVNTGIGKSGRMVISDFGEMSLDLEGALETIKDRRWEGAWGIGILESEIRQKVLSMFSNELTVDELKRLWRQDMVGG